MRVHELLSNSAYERLKCQRKTPHGAAEERAAAVRARSQPVPKSAPRKTWRGSQESHESADALSFSKTRESAQRHALAHVRQRALQKRVARVARFH